MVMRINKKIKRLLFYFFIFVTLLLLSSLLYLFFTSSKMYIQKVTVVPDDYSARLSQVVDGILKEDRWYIIPSSHTTFVPKSKMAEAIYTRYPEINKVTVTHKGFQGLEVKAEFRVPLFRLDNGLAVDTDGVVYLEPKDTSALPLLSVKVTLPNKDKLRSISQFSEKIATTLSKVTTINIDENSDVIYSIANIQGKSFITTSLNDDTEALWSTLVSAITTNPLAQTLETSKESLLYIDLRFGNKVFYKFGKYESMATTSPLSVTATTTNDTRILAEPNR